MAQPPRSFEDIAASVYRMADDPSDDNRRQHKRTAVKGSIPATIYRSQGVPVVARVRDLSRSGIGLTTQIAVRRGERFTLSVNLGKGAVTLHCRVANCRLVDDYYIVGAHFVTIERSKTSEAQDDSPHFANAAEVITDAGPDAMERVRDIEQRLRNFLDE